MLGLHKRALRYHEFYHESSSTIGTCNGRSSCVGLELCLVCILIWCYAATVHDLRSSPLRATIGTNFLPRTPQRSEPISCLEFVSLRSELISCLSNSPTIGTHFCLERCLRAAFSRFPASNLPTIGTNFLPRTMLGLLLLAQESSTFSHESSPTIGTCIDRSSCEELPASNCQVYTATWPRTAWFIYIWSYAATWSQEFSAGGGNLPNYMPAMLLPGTRLRSSLSTAGGNLPNYAWFVYLYLWCYAATISGVLRCGNLP